MNEETTFSVIVPCYNRADLLPEAVQSILCQTFQDFEIIVVDNCSTDNTPEVMHQYENDKRIKYIRNPKNMERGYSRNVGLKTAIGKYVTLLDSDDVMYSDCLQDAYDFAKSNPDTKVFHNLYEAIDQHKRPTFRGHFPDLTDQYKALSIGNFISCIGVFMERDVYRQFFFIEDPRMIGSEDYEIWFRVLAHYSLGRIDKVNSGAREHVGRSIYSGMYENLEYQRQQMVSMIEADEVLRSKYGKYIGYINANYYFHQAIYSLRRRKMSQAWNEFALSLSRGRGIFFSKRFPSFLKNFLFAIFKN